jgi:hypothetical protein
MAHIFINESGDLGFNFKKKKTSRFFIVTFILTNDKNSLDRLIKKFYRGLININIKNHGGVLHAHKEAPNIRKKLLNLFHDKKPAKIITIFLDKKKVYARLHDEKHVLYNYITNILLDRVCSKKMLRTTDKIIIVASRRETNKYLNANFSSYIKDQVRNNHKLNIEIEITSPSNEKGLQIADVISWSIFRKYEHGDDSYYNIIKSEIVEENPLFG